MKTEFELVRSDRRTLAIEVTGDCRVIVRAPARCPRADIDSFVASRSGWIAGALEKQCVRAENHPPLEPEMERELRERAVREIPPRVRHFAEKMGLCPTGVKITGAKTRFGSCSSRNSLCFSWRLMAYPPEAVDYVVVHELAHIAHKNHGSEFYALVASVLPDYRERQRILKS